MKTTEAAIEVLRGTRLAVVTGGSSGIGRSFIATVLEASPGVRVCNLSRAFPGLRGVDHFACDFADPAARRAVFPQVAAWAAGAGAEAGKLLLINNAGFGSFGAFPEPKARDHAEMIQVNVAAMVELTAGLLPELRRRGGAIVNVASTAAFQPMPLMQTYAATKAFVVSWSVALAHELRDSGVRVQALCPGPTRTGFGARAGFAGEVPDWLAQQPEHVVAASLRGLRRGRVVVVPGRLNALVARVAGLVPRRLATALAERIAARAHARPPVAAGMPGPSAAGEVKQEARAPAGAGSEHA